MVKKRDDLLRELIGKLSVGTLWLFRLLSCIITVYLNNFVCYNTEQTEDPTSPVLQGASQA